MSRSFPSSRGSSTSPWYTVGEKMSDKNPEQRINFKFWLKIGKGASETLALLTVAYGEYAVVYKPYNLYVLCFIVLFCIYLYCCTYATCCTFQLFFMMKLRISC